MGKFLTYCMLFLIFCTWVFQMNAAESLKELTGRAVVRGIDESYLSCLNRSNSPNIQRHLEENLFNYIPQELGEDVQVKMCLREWIWKKDGESLIQKNPMNESWISVDYSPCGVFFAACHKISGIYVWLLFNRELFKHIPIKALGNRDILSMHFLPSNSQILVVATSAGIDFFDFINEEWINTIAEDYTVGDLQISDNGFIAFHDALQAYTVDNAHDVVRLYDDDRSCLSGSALSRTGDVLAVGKSPGIFLHHIVHKNEDMPVRTNRYLLDDEMSSAYSLNFSHDGKRIAGISCENVSVWDVSTRDVLGSFALPWRFSKTLRLGQYAKLAFASTCKKLAIGSDCGAIYFYDYEKNNVTQALAEHEGAIDAIKFSPNDKSLGTGSSDGTVQLWRLLNFSELLQELGERRSKTAAPFN